MDTVEHINSAKNGSHYRGIADSDWPLSLMLDEVWLRARRVLVHKLEESGLWMNKNTYQSILVEQRALGGKLKNNLLREVLGRTDYALTSSETVFGPSNNRFRAKTPLVLAFGYELGSGFHALLDGNNDDLAGVAELCSVFNLGISVLDLVCDSDPVLFDDFTEAFNEEVLRCIAEAPGAAQALASSGDKHHSDELRLLLKIIAWFFLRLHDIDQGQGDPNNKKRPGRDKMRQKLLSLMVDAYRAEIRSSSENAASEADLMDISRSKSTLPFEIIHHVARLGTTSDQQAQKVARSLARNLALVFWLTDDLTDVVRDIQGGALNSILIQAGRLKGGRVPDPIRDYPALVQVLDGDNIERMSDRICARVAAVMRILESDNIDPHKANHFREVILFYVRNWL